jgi:hypothetical protein
MVKKKKKANITSRVGKYFMAVQQGSSKREALATAGYAPSGNNSVEKTQEFQALQERFGTNLQQHITVNEINSYLADNIRQAGQTRIDRNARNKAIEIAKNMIEPEGGKSGDDEAKVLIVLSK